MMVGVGGGAEGEGCRKMHEHILYFALHSNNVTALPPDEGQFLSLDESMAKIFQMISIFHDGRCGWGMGVRRCDVPEDARDPHIFRTSVSQRGDILDTLKTNM